MKWCIAALGFCFMASEVSAQSNQLFVPDYVFLDRAAESKQETCVSWSASALMPCATDQTLVSLAGARWYGLANFQTIGMAIQSRVGSWYGGARLQHAGVLGTQADRLECRLARKIDRLQVGAALWIERQARPLDLPLWRPGIELSGYMTLSPALSMLTRFDLARDAAGFMSLCYRPVEDVYASLSLIHDEGRHVFYQACITSYFRNCLHVGATVRSLGRGLALRVGYCKGALGLDVCAQYQSRLGFTPMSFLNYQIMP